MTSQTGYFRSGHYFRVYFRIPFVHWHLVDNVVESLNVLGGGDWWRLVEIGGGWWRLVEVGSGWWRLVVVGVVGRSWL